MGVDIAPGGGSKGGGQVSGVIRAQVWGQVGAGGVEGRGCQIGEGIRCVGWGKVGVYMSRFVNRGADTTLLDSFLLGLPEMHQAIDKSLEVHVFSD